MIMSLSVQPVKPTFTPSTKVVIGHEIGHVLTDNALTEQNSDFRIQLYKTLESRLFHKGNEWEAVAGYVPIKDPKNPSANALISMAGMPLENIVRESLKAPKIDINCESMAGDKEDLIDLHTKTFSTFFDSFDKFIQFLSDELDKAYRECLGSKNINQMTEGFIDLLSTKMENKERYTWRNSSTGSGLTINFDPIEDNDGGFWFSGEDSSEIINKTFGSDKIQAFSEQICRLGKSLE